MLKKNPIDEELATKDPGWARHVEEIRAKHVRECLAAHYVPITYGIAVILRYPANDRLRVGWEHRRMIDFVPMNDHEARVRNLVLDAVRAGRNAGGIDCFPETEVPRDVRGTWLSTLQRGADPLDLTRRRPIGPWEFVVFVELVGLMVDHEFPLPYYFGNIKQLKPYFASDDGRDEGQVRVRVKRGRGRTPLPESTLKLYWTIRKAHERGQSHQTTAEVVNERNKSKGAVKINADTVRKALDYTRRYPNSNPNKQRPITPAL